MRTSPRLAIVYFGLYQFGLAGLQSLMADGRNVRAVVTKPFKDLDEQPVAQWASDNGLPVLYPDSLEDGVLANQIRAFQPDLIAVAGYHKAIPQEILGIPRMGTINTHASLLPAYRGPVPHKWVIVNGEQETGVTIHVMTQRFDRGDILAQRVVRIDDNVTAESLLATITPLAARLLAETVSTLHAGTQVRRPQDESRASYYSYPTDEQAHIRWSLDACHIRNLVRGLNPRPGAWTSFRGKRIRVGKAAIAESISTSLPGSIIRSGGDSLVVATASQDLILQDLRLCSSSVDDSAQVIRHLGASIGESLE